LTQYAGLNVTCRERGTEWVACGGAGGACGLEVVTRQVWGWGRWRKSLVFLITGMMGCHFDLFVQIIQSGS